MWPQVYSVLVWSVSRSLQHRAYVIAGSTQELYTSLEADGNVVFEDIPVFGICRPASHVSSLHLFVLVLFLDSVVLPKYT